MHVSSKKKIKFEIYKRHVFFTQVMNTRAHTTTLATRIFCIKWGSWNTVSWVGQRLSTHGECLRQRTDLSTSNLEPSRRKKWLVKVFTTLKSFKEEIPQEHTQSMNFGGWQASSSTIGFVESTSQDRFGRCHNTADPPMKNEIHKVEFQTHKPGHLLEPLLFCIAIAFPGTRTDLHGLTEQDTTLYHPRRGGGRWRVQKKLALGVRGNTLFRNVPERGDRKSVNSWAPWNIGTE